MSRLTIRLLPLIAIAATAPALLSQTAQPAPCPPSAQQKDSTAPGKSTGKSPDKAAADDPCTSSGKDSPAPAAQQFPFPGESQPAKPQQSTPDAPSAPAGKNTPAADQFPFPGSASAPAMPGSDPDKGSSSSGSSSSSSSSDDPGDAPSADKPPVGDKDTTPKASGRRRLPKVEKLQSDEDRAEEDLKISKFYENAGNLNAAYLRAQDAVKVLPTDPDTHFALAHVAEKLKKRDEAVTEYTTYLQLNPDGLRIKEAHKALEQLQH